MADFVAVLKKTIGGLSNNTPEARERVYQKARDTVAAKLAAMQPPPSSIVVERQKKALETAISAVEAGYAAPEEAEDEFADIFGVAGGTPKTEVAEPEPTVEAVAPPPLEESQPEEPEATEEPAAEAQPESEAEPADHTIAPVPAPEAEFVPEPTPEPAQDATLEPVEPSVRPVPPLAPTPEPAAESKPEEPISAERADAAKRPESSRRRVSGGLIAAVIAVVVVAGAGYGVWLNRDAFMAMLPSTTDVVVAPEGENGAADNEIVADDQATPAEETAAAATDEPAAASEDQTAADDQQKFTQRLTAEGDEVDPGPAGGEASVGEGTSVASATQNGDQQAGAANGDTQAATDNQLSLPVGQRAIFYEERTTSSDSTAEAGATVWSVVQESPGGDLPPEPAIRAEVTVPSKGLQLRMTIRRNADPSLPAAHIIEMIFLTPDGFEGGGVDNVLRVALKPTEAAAGSPLIGIPAKIADGYFLIALSDVAEEEQFNLQQMRQQSWIDVPIVYGSGRRALVTMERGVPGDRAFVDVLATWAQLESEQESTATAGN